MNWLNALRLPFSNEKCTFQAANEEKFMNIFKQYERCSRVTTVHAIHCNTTNQRFHSQVYLEYYKNQPVCPWILQNSTGVLACLMYLFVFNYLRVCACVCAYVRARAFTLCVNFRCYALTVNFKQAISICSEALTS